MSMSIDEPLDDELSGEIHDGDGGRIIRSLAADDGDLSPSMTITESGIAGRPVPSISVAPVNTVAVVGALLRGGRGPRTVRASNNANAKVVSFRNHLVLRVTFHASDRIGLTRCTRSTALCRRQGKMDNRHILFS